MTGNLLSIGKEGVINFAKVACVDWAVTYMSITVMVVIINRCHHKADHFGRLYLSLVPDCEILTYFWTDVIN